jgi:tetratricopeptide (TPR) repeat protein
MSKADKLKKKAVEFEAKRQTDKAIAAYLDLFKEWEADPTAPVDVAIYNRVGDMLLKAGNVGDAMTVWETAVDHYAEGGLHNNAIALCNKILRNSPGRTSVYYKLGKISAQKGFRGDARKNYLEYADRMQKTGQIDEAFRALKEFADLSPEDNDIRQMLADQLMKIGRSAEAIEQLQMLYEKYESTGDTAATAATLARMRAIDPAVEPKRSGPRRESRPAGLVFINVDEPPDPRARKSTAAPAPATPAAPPKRATNNQKYVTDAKTKTATQGLPLIDLDDEPPEPVAAPREEAVPEPVIPTPMQVIPAPVEDVPIPSILDEAPIVAEAEPMPSLLDEAPAIFETTEMAPSILDDAPIATPPESTPSILDDASIVTPVASLPWIVDESPIIGEEAPALPEPGNVAAFPEFADAPALPELEESETFPVLEEVPEEAEEAPIEVNAEAPPEPPREVPAEPLPLIMEDPSFGASFGTSDEPGDTLPPSDLETDALRATPEFNARVSSSLSLPEDLTFGSASVAPFASPTGEAESLDLVSEPIEFGDSSASIGGDADTSLVFDSFAELSATPAGEMSEEEAPAPREAITRKSMRPTMSALALSVDSLRERVRADVTNWNLRRQFAEALLEDGDREGGLAELETSMVGFERATDYESARSVAEEIIRLQPLSVRHHQKRVEYSYRMNDRVRLIDAYLDLADALFREGETEKSKSVYERVLELAPDDMRAVAAMSGFEGDAAPLPEAEVVDDGVNPFITDADLEDEPPAPVTSSRDEEEPDEHDGLRPSLEAAIDESFRDSLATPAIGNHTIPGPASQPPLPQAEPAKPFADGFGQQRPATHDRKNAESASEFVDMGDWLKEEEGPKSTRMRVPEQAPTGDETADFNDMLRKFKQGVAKNVEDEDHESHYDLGVAFKEMGLVDEAIAEFQKALRSPTHRVRTYEALGQCFVDKSQEQVAVSLLQRALSEPGTGDDKLIGVLYLLGVSCEKLGQPRDAVKYYQRVFAVDINFRDVRKRMREIEQAAR